MMAFIQNLGLPELLLIFVIVLLLFGAGRLPQIARSLGNSLQEFKKGLQEPDRPPHTDGGRPPEQCCGRKFDPSQKDPE